MNQNQGEVSPTEWDGNSWEPITFTEWDDAQMALLDGETA